jgi:hypothetical protein
MNESPTARVEFSRRELAKLTAAVEAIDEEELAAELRVADLKEEVRALRAKTRVEAKRAYREGLRAGFMECTELCERWRRAYESMRDILVHSGPNGDLERLDQIIRGWVGEA